MLSNLVVINFELKLVELINKSKNFFEKKNIENCYIQVPEQFKCFIFNKLWK